MITETATTALESYINSKGLELPIYPPRGDDTMTYPCIQIGDSSADEDEVLDGVYEVSIEVAYIATPNANTDAGDTEEEITDKSSEVYNVLSCEQMISILNIQPGIKVFDVFMGQLSSEERDGRSASVYNLELVCCEV